MADFRTDEPHKRRSGSTTLLIVLVAAIAIVGLLFATGFWSADVTKQGALPEVSVKGGALPSVDLDSKKVVVGTTKTEVEVPKIKTETETVSVPTIGVTAADKK